MLPQTAPGNWPKPGLRPSTAFLRIAQASPDKTAVIQSMALILLFNKVGSPDKETATSPDLRYMPASRINRYNVKYVIPISRYNEFQDFGQKNRYNPKPPQIAFEFKTTFVLPRQLPL
jgi:hypothetical protein